MAAAVTIAPIRPGRVEEWRGFVAELQGSRRIEWVQSQRRRGITRQVISLSHGDVIAAVIYTESADPGEARRLLAESGDPFDEWFRSRLADLHDDPFEAEVVFDSAPRPGPWRGWR